MSPNTPIDWQAVRDGVAAHMKRAGLSQNKLAKASGVAAPTLSEFLSGKNNTSTESLAAIASALQVTVGELLGETAAPHEGTEIVGLTHDQLAESPGNPRKAMDDQALMELASSIAEAGVLQNLVVSAPGADGIYVIVAGARRFRAVRFLAQQGDRIAGIPAGDYRIPCRVVAGEPVEIMTLAITENLQREDLSPMEEAEAFDLAARIARDVGADMTAAAGRQLRDEEYLKSCGRAHLAEIAADLRCQVTDSHTAKQVRGFIADALLLADEIGYVPRELRWGRDALLPDQRAERDREAAEEAAALEEERRIEGAEDAPDGTEDDEDDAIDRLTARDDDADEDDAPALQASADDLEIPAFLRRV